MTIKLLKFFKKMGDFMVRLANINDLTILSSLDKHISYDEMKLSIDLGRVYVLTENEKIIGWLRFNYFWSNIPFIDMLYINQEHQGKGCGKKLMSYFEQEIKCFGQVMVSTQSNEYAQHFYEKLGYKAIGGFTIPDEEYELIMYKSLK